MNIEYRTRNKECRSLTNIVDFNIQNYSSNFDIPCSLFLVPCSIFIHVPISPKIRPIRHLIIKPFILIYFLIKKFVSLQPDN